jgi:hypothetical protein
VGIILGVTWWEFSVRMLAIEVYELLKSPDPAVFQAFEIGWKVSREIDDLSR